MIEIKITGFVGERDVIVHDSIAKLTADAKFSKLDLRECGFSYEMGDLLYEKLSNVNRINPAGVTFHELDNGVHVRNLQAKDKFWLLSTDELLALCTPKRKHSKAKV